MHPTPLSKLSIKAKLRCKGCPRVIYDKNWQTKSKSEDFGKISNLTCIIMASIQGNPVLASLQAASNSSSFFHGIYIEEYVSEDQDNY